MCLQSCKPPKRVPLVKLNNPLMGTETTLSAVFFTVLVAFLLN